jgi:protein SCO1/2
MAAAALLTWVAGPGFAAAADAVSGQDSAQDHSQHQMDHSGHAVDHSGHNMDHSGHDMDHSGHGNAAGDGGDPHAHHRAMMQQEGYKRSEHEYPLGDFDLVDMQGRNTTFKEAIDCGKPVMVNFIFTTCTTICPVMSATFTQVQNQLGAESDNVCMISVSIDPEHDTPERLVAYAERFSAGPQWNFFTGSEEDIVALQKSVDVFRGNKMNHEPTTLLRRAEGGPWVRVDGLASAADIVREYRQLVEQ